MKPRFVHQFLASRDAQLSSCWRVPARAMTLVAAAVVMMLPAMANVAHGQAMSPPKTGDVPLTPPAGMKPPGFEEVGITQKLGAAVPADLVFKDETGADVRLGDYFNHGRPILLTLVYFGCPNLCTVVLNESQKALKTVPLNPGSDFDVVVVSFDPKETPALAAEKKASYLAKYSRAGTDGGWHYLTGSEASIKGLTEAVGFRYAWDDRFKQYIHPGGLMILTPDGHISKYFYGVQYEPRDVRLALVEASGNQIGKLADQVLSFCFTYDVHSGKYTLAVTNILKVAGILTVLGLGTFLFINLRKDWRGGNGSGGSGGGSVGETDASVAAAMAPAGAADAAGGAGTAKRNG